MKSPRTRTSRSTTARSSKKSVRAVKRKLKTPEQKAKERLWELCKDLTRARYGNVCFTCGKGGLSGASWHTGHFLPSSTCGAFLRYDLRNLRPQCYFCNINLGGNGAAFYQRLVETEGQAYVDQLFLDRNTVVKADLKFYTGLIERYTHMTEKLK